MTEPQPASGSTRGGVAFLWFLGFWLAAMFARVWYISVTVDGNTVFAGFLVALLFGFFTVQGVVIYFLPGFAALGGHLAGSAFKESYPKAPHVLAWIAMLIGALIAAAFALYGAFEPCNPVYERCIP